MSLADEVRVELETYEGDKSALMQNYSKQQQAIINRFGGNFSDVPVDNNGEYAQLQNKIMILSRLV